MFLFSGIALLRSQNKIAEVKSFIKNKDTGLYALKQVVSPGSDPFINQFIRVIDFNHDQLVGHFGDCNHYYDLLAQQDSIGIYLIVITKVSYNKKTGYNTKPVIFWRDTARLSSFLTKFNSLYHSTLNENSVRSFRFHRFGRACSVSGAPTERFAEMQKLVAGNDQVSLKQWIRAFDYETKVIGAFGLLKLQKAGMQIGKEDQEIISRLRMYHYFINFCSGCTSWEPNPSSSLLSNYSIW